MPSEILALAIENRAEFERLDLRARAALSRQLDGVLELVLEEMSDASGRALFARSRARWVALALETLDARTAPALARVLLTAFRGGHALGGAHAAEEIAAWQTLRGASASLNVSAAASVADEILVERVASSLARWKQEGVARMKPHLLRATLPGGGEVTAAAALERALGARRFVAERIARTELSSAYHAAHLSTLEQVRDNGLPVQKTCIAVFDSRTAQDSVAVHNQIRELDEEFEDGAGRRYLAPPGRPNDREKMVAYLPPI